MPYGTAGNSTLLVFACHSVPDHVSNAMCTTKIWSLAFAVTKGFMIIRGCRHNQSSPGYITGCWEAVTPPHPRFADVYAAAYGVSAKLCSCMQSLVDVQERPSADLSRQDECQLKLQLAGLCLLPVSAERSRHRIEHSIPCRLLNTLEHCSTTPASASCAHV